jgi:hypothetical protein
MLFCDYIPVLFLTYRLREIMRIAEVNTVVPVTQTDPISVSNRYFQIDLVHDRYRFFALLAYALACEKEAPELAKHLRDSVFVPMPSKRDDRGYWYHPAFPNVDDKDDLFNLESWLKSHKMRAEFVTIPDDDVLQAIYDSPEYMINGDCNRWIPQPPADDCFFLFGIYPTEVGPYACYIAAPTLQRF